MFVEDVDGDGDGDVITSLAAHHFGLSWFEQVRRDGAIAFVEHRFLDWVVQPVTAIISGLCTLISTSFSMAAACMGKRAASATLCPMV